MTAIEGTTSVRVRYETGSRARLRQVANDSSPSWSRGKMDVLHVEQGHESDSKICRKQTWQGVSARNSVSTECQQKHNKRPVLFNLFWTSCMAHLSSFSFPVGKKKRRWTVQVQLQRTNLRSVNMMANWLQNLPFHNYLILLLCSNLLHDHICLHQYDQKVLKNKK